ncbi:hypothetical protein HN954_03575 [bacterium]|nr:hypothetical protein [bacterium]MBT6996483.1 hypothetical protein [bacterium]MBT7772499.1 hypothetical protein [bacterium]
MKKFIWAFFAVAVVLTACVVPEKDDPFERLPEEKLETLSGEIFPFDISVSTRATHRLEKDEKLVALLASDIVRLEDFEGRDVELDGVFRTEKMREIFWVYVVRAQDVPVQNSEKTEERFETKNFTFVFSVGWESSTAPNGTVHFVEKSDEARRVFLTFEVGEVSKLDKKSDPNVLIANLAGIKKTSSDELGRERQTISLFSNLSDRKYTFEFTSSFEEFEKKKEFFKLLNSFVEGSANVRHEKDKDLRAQAAAEAEKLSETPIKNEEIIPNPESLPEPEIEEKEGLFSKFFGKNDESESVDFEKVEEVFQSELFAEEPKNFTNLVNEKAFDYSSEYFGFSMKSPWGFWFNNFGATDTKLTRIGFANHKIETESDVDFWLEIVGDDRATSKFLEKRTGAENEIVVIKWPRTATSFFNLTGPIEFRDAMLSIQGTVKSSE